MSEQAIPRKVGRYRIDGVLGEGTMAVVYAGFDPGIEREVAIKCLHQEVAADPGYRRRFLAEARAAGHLTHPHIVTIFDAGEADDGRAYIAMERLAGETLASRVARKGFPPLPVIIELAGELAAALDYAHAHGVVHHDIKPENIMLADGWQHAKINDFGIAECRASRDDPNAPRTEIGGTPAYMAPEHLRGEPTDARSDLFSLGVVLYWLVVGKLPWAETHGARRMLLERQRLPRPPIQPRDPSTPSILVDIVHTLLAPDAATRYQRGGEVVGDLRMARREYERLHEKPLANRIISLRLRWTGVLGAVLSLTLLLGLAAIHAKQNAAITGLALDFGSSLGRMVASESAEDLLLGDRAATRALVEDMARNQQIHYLAIADRYGEVIASTQPEQVGHRLPALVGPPAPMQAGDVKSYRGHLADSANQDDMLVFDVPVRYQVATVGELRLGVSDAPLRAARKTTLWVIVAVLLATLAAVVGAAWWMSRRLLALLDVLGSALLRVARGDFRYRIRLVRRDELGRLFAVFNLMNSALQSRPRRARQTASDGAADDVARPRQILSVPVRDDDAPPASG
ncbi:serine/threonine-protein kinase [Rhodanobacter sp. T12-5]|uniref:serine/threonine-protein kinase n=1 Tax=Rhodanobacter sp. T12-5 TaxID=2024611 RepID=UPI0011EDAAA1|nr:serine/threonine-protein kinase [Rhodanobacter sp. T12-5]KAA0072160.1 HAMP domain-containing protein [Rhodanobacter sp. T12-5]